MNLQQIDSRLNLWCEYWLYVMDAKQYGLERSWWRLVQLSLRQPVMTFDQWLFENQKYDLVDLNNYYHYTRILRPILFSTVSDFDNNHRPQELMNLFKEIGHLVEYPRLTNFFIAGNQKVDKWGAIVNPDTL